MSLTEAVPNKVKIMTWNIQNYGPKKANADVILECIAKTIVNNDVDIFILIELRNLTALKRLSQKLNTLSKAQDPNYDYYKGYFYSPRSSTATLYRNTTHYEYYGFIVKNAHVHEPKGFSTPSGKSAYHVEDDGKDQNSNTVMPDTLPRSSGYNGKKYVNGMYLYKYVFPHGRPPSWARFSTTAMEFDIMAVHFRPYERMAFKQMVEVCRFTHITKSPRIPWIITGDYNLRSQELSSREASDILNKVVSDFCAQLSLYPFFTRASQPTHVSGNVYDNFYSRSMGIVMDSPLIVQPRDVINALRGIANAKSALLEYIRGRVDEKEIGEMVTNFIDYNNLTAYEEKEVFKLISDHYPISIVCRKNSA